MSGGGRGTKHWGRRLLWFVALWAAGVATVAAVAYGLRLWIGA